MSKEDLKESSYVNKRLEDNNGAKDSSIFTSLTTQSTTQISKSLGIFGSTSYHAPGIYNDPKKAMKDELEGDALLRIMQEEKTKASDRLIMLAEKGDIHGINEMIQNDNIDLASIEGLHGYSPLHHACNRNQAAIVSLLIKAGVDLSQRNHAGDTALHFASYAGNMLVVEQLIDCGADIDAINDDGETALFYAARLAKPALVRLLLQRGANIDIKDRFGDMAQDQAEDVRTLDVFTSHVLLQKQLISRAKARKRILRNSPASDSDAESDSISGLSLASRLPYTELLQIFRYLTAKDVCCAAMVSGKWHRVSECEEIWKGLGVRRWELALQNSLGFDALPVGNLGRFASKKRREKLEKEKSTANSNDRVAIF